MDDRKYSERLDGLTIYSVLANLVTQYNFVNLCIITKVHNEDFCDVRRYCLDSEGDDIVITDVRLVHPGTAKCKVVVEPDVGDYVLLLTPKDFVPKMDFGHEPDFSGEGTELYSDINAVGILIKAEGDDDVNVSVKVDLDGNVSISAKGEVSVGGDTITLQGDDYGGLCKTPELAKQLDKMTRRIDGIMDALKNSPTGSQDGGAAYKSGIVGMLSSITDKEDFSEIESEKTMHGSGDN